MDICIYFTSFEEFSGDWYLLVFCKPWAIIRSPLSVRIMDICSYFTSLERFSSPLHWSGWLIFVCILQVLSNYSIPVICQVDLCLLEFYKSWAIIRSPLSVRMTDICIDFTSLEQLSNSLHRWGWSRFACILQVLRNSPIPFIGQGDTYIYIYIWLYMIGF